MDNDNKGNIQEENITDIEKEKEIYRLLREKNAILERALEAERTMNSCIKCLYESDSRKEAIYTILTQLGHFFQADRAFSFDIHGTAIKNIQGWHNGRTEPKWGVYKNISSSILGFWLDQMRRHKTIMFRRTEAVREEYPETWEYMHKAGIDNMVLMPVLDKGELAGMIGIYNIKREADEEFSLLGMLGSFLSLFVEKISMKERLTEQSYIDGLTGLYNRNRYMEDLKSYAEKNDVVGIVYVDVNGLKYMNDHFGHQYGDEVLKQSANILEKAFPAGNIYRIGGDEFVVMQRDITNQELEERVESARRMFCTKTSHNAAVGWVWVEKGEDLTSAISYADKKMYDDKMEYYRQHPDAVSRRYGRNFGAALIDKSVLREEIVSGNFHVYLQPKVDFENKRLIGAEALTRYIDTSGELHMPGSFISILEDAKTIHYLDFYVFKTVCGYLDKWKREGIKLIPVSINFSIYTISLPGFIEYLEDIWSGFGIERKYLEIELMEGTEAIDTELLSEMVQRIKRAGFSVSLDDFGVTYSNLTLFTNSNVDTLKLDKNLIDDIYSNRRSQLLVKSLVHICHNLGMRIIVEGVEWPGQFELLAELECDGAQGYLISKPISFDEFEQQFINKKEGEI